MFELLLNSDLLIVLADLFLIHRCELVAATFSNLCLLLIVRLRIALSLSFAHVLIESGEKIVGFFLLDKVRARLWQIKAIVVLIAIL
jgi:hypothetical protein